MIAHGRNMAKIKSANNFMEIIMPKHLRDFYIACAFAALLAIAGFAFAFLR